MRLAGQARSAPCSRSECELSESSVLSVVSLVNLALEAAGAGRAMHMIVSDVELVWT